MSHPLDIVRQVRKLTDACCVALSGGKDSLSCAELCHQHGFKMAAYFMYTVPGLEFEEEILRYCERRYKMTVHRLPHHGLTDQLQLWVYRKPAKDDDVLILVNKDVENEARRLSGIPWIASGQKKCDSLQRRAMLSKCGGIKLRRRNFYPLAEWHHRHTFNFLKMHGVPLPSQYGLTGGSWGGRLDWKSLGKIKKCWPRDFDRIKEYFPFVEAGEMRERIIRERTEQVPVV